MKNAFLANPLPDGAVSCSLVTPRQVTNRRVNALENVTIPRMEAVISYINRELDELERYGIGSWISRGCFALDYRYFCCSLYI